MKRLLLTGGCGYVGSHVLRLLLERGHDCVIYDNLSTGHREALSGGRLVEGDVGDRDRLSRLLVEERFDAILHFAGFIEAGESMECPGKYFDNNVARPLALLESLKAHGVPPLLFSSTAAVYGTPLSLPIEETAPLMPTNTYGLTKLMFEEMLRTYGGAHGLRAVSLRYFNAAGAHPSGDLGEDHHPESHLIPLVCRAALGRRDTVKIYGADYPTFDGTCIRDYIHVTDLAEAHLLALEALLDGRAAPVYNLGNGKGYSVRQVIATVKEVTGIDFPVVEVSRRPGDPAALVASSAKAARDLGWVPRHSLSEIVQTAWQWHSSHPSGYAAIPPRAQPLPSSA